MKLAQVDFLAVNQNSFLHAWSVGPKLVAALFLLVGIVAASSLMQVVLFLSLLLAALIGARLPLLLLGGTFYPAFFSLPFALTRLSATPQLAIVVVGKAVAAALLLIILIATTPFPQLFGVIGRFLPRLVEEGVFFTYRLFFISLRSLENLLFALRQRGTFSSGNWLWSMRATLQAIGYLVVNTTAISQRLEQNYRLRGYEAEIYTVSSDCSWQLSDCLLLAALLSAVGGVLWFG